MAAADPPAGRADRNGLEILDQAACLTLLGRSPIGRIAYIGGDVARVVPVNIAVQDGAVFFRVGTGRLLAAITDGQVLSLEADAIDADACCGWSVVAIGHAREVPRRPDDPAAAVGSWLRDDAARLVCFVPLELSGRRLHPTRADSAERPGRTSRGSDAQLSAAARDAGDRLRRPVLHPVG